jgi:hypothetical protein
MRNLTSRIQHLEQRTTADEKALRCVVTRGGAELALDTDRCAEILTECGFLQDSTGLSLIDLLDVPDGLNARELERHLREHGEEICGGGSDPHGASKSARKCR